MVEIILKNNIGQSKIDALLHFLKPWDIEVELKTTVVNTSKKNEVFSLATGLWKEYDIDAEKLRNQAWVKLFA